MRASGRGREEQWCDRCPSRVRPDSRDGADAHAVPVEFVVPAVGSGEWFFFTVDPTGLNTAGIHAVQGKDGTWYLATAPDGIKPDNLDELPTVPVPSAFPEEAELPTLLVAAPCAYMPERAGPLPQITSVDAWIAKEGQHSYKVSAVGVTPPPSVGALGGLPSLRSCFGCQDGWQASRRTYTRLRSG